MISEIVLFHDLGTRESQEVGNWALGDVIIERQKVERALMGSDGRSCSSPV